jgi:hypothetical protein
MNFKYFIIALYSLFVILIVVMVFKSCGQNIGLESKDYYNEELKYQSTIDAKLLGNPYIDSFIVGEQDNKIVILSPASLQSDSIKVHFKREDDSSKDRRFVYLGNVISKIDKTEFSAGFYQVYIRCFAGKKEFLIEKRIKI